MKEKHIVWIIQAYEEKFSDGKISNVVTLQLIAKSEKDALKRAKELINKKEYRLCDIIEKYI